MRRAPPKKRVCLGLKTQKLKNSKTQKLKKTKFGMLLAAALFVLALALAVALALKRARPVSLYLAHMGLRELMRDFDEICAAHGIVYWADSGTLLGAVRDGGIIGHDDDIDVCVPEAGLDALWSAVAADRAYRIYETDACLKFERIGVPEVWIDIFLVARDGNHVAYTNEWARALWPSSFYAEQELFPLRRVPFDQGHVWVPRDPEPYLERMYGNWRVPVVYARH